jgi:hypothetical protein
MSAENRRTAFRKNASPPSTRPMEASIAMIIDDIKLKDLTQSEREVLKEDGKRWHRMGAGGHLDDWLAYYPGLAIRRRLAMRMAFVNKPEGRGYAIAFAELMKADDLSDDATKTSFTAVLWLGDDPERTRILREMREAMSPGERSRLNSPISARQRVEKALKARAEGTEETVKASPVAQWKEKVVKLEEENAALQAKLAKHDDGLLFDLKRDKADDIAVSIVNSVSENKARAIAASITGWFKTKQKPAG